MAIFGIRRFSLPVIRAVLPKRDDNEKVSVLR